MKHILIAAALLSCIEMRAQNTGIDSVLRQIEANNKELQANAQLISSQKLENKTENNLPAPSPLVLVPALSADYCLPDFSVDV